MQSPSLNCNVRCSRRGGDAHTNLLNCWTHKHLITHRSVMKCFLVSANSVHRCGRRIEISAFTASRVYRRVDGESDVEWFFISNKLGSCVFCTRLLLLLSSRWLGCTYAYFILTLEHLTGLRNDFVPSNGHLYNCVVHVRRSSSLWTNWFCQQLHLQTSLTHLTIYKYKETTEKKRRVEEKMEEMVSAKAKKWKILIFL